jgi:HSP20 family protein
MAFPVQERAEREVAAWNPVAELEQVTKQLARLVDEAWGSGWPTPALRGLDEFIPPADLEETDDAYILEVELPGVHKKDLDVEISGRRLTVSGERKERERIGILRRRTRSVGRFYWEVVLPGEVDESSVKAALVDGVLTVTVPKAPSERRQRQRIPVQ